MSASPCKGCGRPVVFAKDPDGKWQVLDNVAPVWRQVGSKDGIAYVVREPKALVSHFSTCSKPDQFSASKRPEQLAMPEPERHFSEPGEQE